MRRPKIGDLRAVARRAWRAITSAAVILNYHRIVDLESDPWGMAVSPKHFSEHLEVIQRLGWAVRLEDLVKAHHSGRIPKRSIVLTFDDGYLDSLQNAKPELERLGIPATFYVTAGRFTAKREYWWDELENLLLRPGTLPSVLDLAIRGERQRFDLGEGAVYSHVDWDSDRSARIWEARPGTRLSFYEQVHRALRPLQHSEQQAALDAIASWAGVTPSVRSTHQTLTADEVLQLASGTLVEIGAHTLTHMDLAKCDPELQEAEISGGKRSLEALLGRPVGSFAYPFGVFGPESSTIVCKAGFQNACTTAAMSMRRSSDRYLLPRMGVLDCNGEIFERWLRRCFQT